MNKSIRVWWSTGPEPGNLGDILTPHILKHFGHDPIWTGQLEADLICVGSILKFAAPGMRVVGSGAMWEHDTPSPEADFLAVRGPLTKAIVEGVGGICPDVFGDPALLLPEVSWPLVEPKYEVGIVPHYVDRDQEVLNGWHLIDPLRADPWEVVREILQCRTVLSSSLHGIIVAHAYGIPAAWIRLGDRLSGDDTKFRDYAMSVGVDLIPYPTPEQAIAVVPTIPDLEPLREAFRCL